MRQWSPKPNLQGLHVHAVIINAQSDYFHVHKLAKSHNYSVCVHTWVRVAGIYYYIH